MQLKNYSFKNMQKNLNQNIILSILVVDEPLMGR